MEEVLSNLTYNAEGFKAPVAQFGPAPVNSSLAMFDLFSHPIFKKAMIASLEYNVPVISEPTNLDFLLQHIDQEDTTANSARDDDTDSSLSSWNSILNYGLELPKDVSSASHKVLRSFTLDQVREDFHPDSKTIGYLVGVLQWNSFFEDILPGKSSMLQCVAHFETIS